MKKSRRNKRVKKKEDSPMNNKREETRQQERKRGQIQNPFFQNDRKRVKENPEAEKDHNAAHGM